MRKAVVGRRRRELGWTAATIKTDGGLAARRAPTVLRDAVAAEALRETRRRRPYEAYDAAARRRALDLVVQAGNAQLILDPDLDSYYVMDALITKLPAIADNAGRAVDLEVVVAADDSIENQIALAGAQGALRVGRGREPQRAQTAFEKTADPELEPELAPGVGSSRTR